MSVASLGILEKDSNIEKSMYPGSGQDKNTSGGCGGGGHWGRLCQTEKPVLYPVCTRCGEKMSWILNTLSSRFLRYLDRGAQLQVGVRAWRSAKRFSMVMDCFESYVYNMLLIHQGVGVGGEITQGGDVIVFLKVWSLRHLHQNPTGVS